MKKLLPLLTLGLLLVPTTLRNAGLAQTTQATQTTQAAPAPSAPLHVTVLGLNDFHGNLLPTTFPALRQPAGGAEIIGGYVDSVRAANPDTVFVGGGDLIGASPVISSLLRDEPGVLALSRMGMSVSALGNHEFDQGLTELLRMQNGGCAGDAPALSPEGGACRFQNPYPGAGFRWLGANVVDRATGKPVFAPYRIVTTPGGARLAFVGAVTRTTPTLVSPSGISTLEFLDEADSVNRYLPEIEALKPDAIILLIHEGGAAGDPYNVAGCTSLTGRVVDIARRLDPAVDAVISGHTHQGYNCLVPGPTGRQRVVIQGDFYGHLLQRLDLTVDPAAHRLLDLRATNVVMDASPGTTIPKSAAQTELVARARSLTDALRNTAVAALSVPQISRTANAAGESALGDVVADAQLAATRGRAVGSAVIALTNPGGIRADLPDSGSVRPGNVVSYGDVFGVQPFSNALVTLTLTGDQLRAVLEQQFGNPTPGERRVLQVSRGLHYAWDASAPAGSRVSALTLDGAAISPGGTYRVTVNSFLAGGGDGFTGFGAGTERLEQPDLTDTDALERYLRAAPVAPGAQDRIIRK